MKKRKMIKYIMMHYKKQYKGFDLLIARIDLWLAPKETISKVLNKIGHSIVLESSDFKDNE